MEENSCSDSKSIIDFDDEYSENVNEKQNEKSKSQKTDTNLNEQIEQSKNNYQEQEDEVEQENQDNIAPEEEEEQVENDGEENIIYDPKIKELNEIDINNKQAIIDILMQDSLITKKPLKTEASIKEKNKNKFAYVESTMNTNKNNADNLSKKNLYGRVGYQIEAQEGDPQFVKDINIAAYLLKDQIQEENQDVAKLLFDDITQSPNNKRVITRKQIGEKIKKTLEKKRKNLEKIEAKMYEEQKSQETFTPSINHRKKDENKRDFNSFLKAQNAFQEKVELKKKNIIQRNEEDMKEINVGKPQVNKNSEELAKKLSSGDEPVYMRLYNKRMSHEKIKEAEEKRIIQEKEEEKKRKEKENELKKNNPYKHVKSKINILKKSPSQAGVDHNKDGELPIKNGNNKNNKIKIPFNRNEKVLNKREKSAINIRRNPIKKLFDVKDLPTNKMLWNKFIKNFDEALINLNPDNNNNNNDNNNNNNESNLEELDQNQYHKLLYNLGMVTYPPEEKEFENEEKKTKEENEENNIEIENILKVDEKKLIDDSFNLLKVDNDKVKTVDVKKFLIFVLDNQNYDLYQQYKTNHEQEIKDLFPLTKYRKEDIPELILKKQNEELIANIDKTNNKNNKYYSLAKDGNIIFTLDKSQNIKKDFNMFSLNYRNKRKKGKEEKIINIIKEQYPFKPTINANSEKLYQKYKDKVCPIQNDTVTSNSQFKKTNMEYIDRILLLDKKRIAENQKIKEEMQKKEIKECTFKPKINQSYPMAKKGNKEANEEKKNIDKNKNDKNIKKNKSKNKFEELYEKGKNKIQAKKNKPREDIELEQQRKECTFKPNINNLNIQKIPKTNFNNDIYNEKEYKYLYERLKHGRLERMVKESNNDRYGLNNELKQFVKDNKEFNYIHNPAYFSPEDPFYNNEQNKYENNFNNNNNNEEVENNIKQEKVNNRSDNNNNNNNNNNNKNLQNEQVKQEEGGSENELDPEKKEEIPLLIIDVNIRQGVKKKIYVYEGDTPEDLAEKFAKEHNLEPETKNKLQSLIHSHMLRLLTRIEEENQSISEKSQNLHNQKSN